MSRRELADVAVVFGALIVALLIAHAVGEWS